MNSYLIDSQARVESFLDQSLSESDAPGRLRDAMRYSTLAGGKRIRALLVYATGFATSAPIEKLDVVACALEFIHSYSLIHDDLPSMDDDDLRRGQATSHIQFDEATAILSGDALLTLAFELINDSASPLSDTQCRIISHKLANCAGQVGMVGGQMLDVLATQPGLNISNLGRDALEDIHRRKTGALINASVVCGAFCSETVSKNDVANLSNYANNIGLAFQVMDDVLDVESNTQQLGKQAGADNTRGKSTYPELLGLNASKQLAQTLCQDAIDCIASIGDNTQHLVELAAIVVNRTN
ncbi:MAG: geranylgeranyl pyrophosphate synthase [Arenicella sp.]